MVKKRNINIFIKTLIFLIVSMIILKLSTAVLAVESFEKTYFISEVKKALEMRENVIFIEYNTGFDEIDIDVISSCIQNAVEASPDVISNTIEQWEVELKGNNQGIEIKIKVDYRSSIEKDRYVQQQSRQIVENLISNEMNIHQKIKEITDYIAQNIRYDHHKNNYTAYDALKYGQVTCQGYALFAHYLLNQADINNIIIHGVLEGERHAWNLLEVNGYWYHLDLTQISSYYHTNGFLFYNEYLLEDDMISLSHSWEKKDYPDAFRRYHDQLKAEKYLFKNTDEYNNFLKELNLIYLSADYTAKSVSELEIKIKNNLKNKMQIIELRIYPELLSIDVINNTIENLVKGNPEIIESYTGWELNLFLHYFRDGLKGTGIARITFK